MVKILEQAHWAMQPLLRLEFDHNNFTCMSRMFVRTDASFTLFLHKCRAVPMYFVIFTVMTGPNRFLLPEIKCNLCRVVWCTDSWGSCNTKSPWRLWSSLSRNQNIRWSTGGLPSLGMSTFQFFVNEHFGFFWSLRKKMCFVFVFEIKEKQRFVYCLLIKILFLFLNVLLSFIV